MSGWAFVAGPQKRHLLDRIWAPSYTRIGQDSMYTIVLPVTCSLFCQLVLRQSAL